MGKNNSFYDTVDQIVTHGVQKGILHLYNEDNSFQGNHIILKGRDVVNFGSCSYLGLEFDPRLKEAAKQAIDKYGTQFSESRAYVSLGLYKELEHLLQKIFGAFCVVTPTTTLGHIANIPVLVKDDEAVIMDHQVHNSIQTAVSILKSRGVHIELLRHNRMDLLEERVKLLRTRYQKIWYMADGIYSMFGDYTPVNDVYSLLDKYSELYYYVDDAHGMSIYGKHGRGFVLNNRPMHAKMALAASLNKAFAAGGGVMVYPQYELARKVRTTGGPLITSGPMQPAALGAAIASAKIHLSNEIYEMQEDLHDKIKFTKLMLQKYGLPLISSSNASVFFIGVSLPKLGYNLVKRMLQHGYYLNLGIFPAVPMKNTGIRFTITRLHTFAQIEEMIATMAREFPKALKEEEMTIEQIYKAFKLPVPEDLLLERSIDSVLNQSLSLKCEHYQSITEVKKEEWDNIFEGKGTFDWDNLKMLEESFSHNKLPEDNWVFDYFIVKNLQGKILLATFLTTALWKDDMLEHSFVSRQIEENRSGNPYYLTSKVITTGSLITEGEHLYIDKSSALWNDAMQLFIEKLYALQEKYRANSIVVRDFQEEETLFDNLMVDNGFFRISMPDTNRIESLEYKNNQEFYKQLSKCSKEHFRKKIRRHESNFVVETITGPASQKQIDSWYQLYCNVKSRSLELNTFHLPKKLFAQLTKNNNWEVLTMKLKTAEVTSDEPVCVVFCYKSKDTYIPMIIGLDYTYNKEYNIYRQALYQLVMRSSVLGKKKMFLGFGASIEKRKMGAKTTPVHAYMNVKDSFNHQVLSGINKMPEKTFIQHLTS